MYTFYGSEANATEVKTFVNHIIDANLKAEETGSIKSPICIWGTHGIGKTALAEEIAREKNYKFVYIAPAQFEETGDLIGMPTIENGATTFKHPDWVPTEAGPGILLIDDVNRADDRILRSIMQLLQNFEMVSWKLPEKWQIVLTANPDGGDYSVTPMDDAMLTRMMHITMKFDAKAWAAWAEKNKVDARGINFVLTYPEISKGRRTTPRTLTQFFRSIESIENLKENLPLVQMLGASCLDEETVAAFVTFVQQNLAELITPAEILNAKNFGKEVENALKKTANGKIFRVDIIATVCTRLANYLIINDLKPTPAQMKNIQSFIKIDFIPNDLRIALLQDIFKSPNPHLRTIIMTDPALSKMLATGM